MRTWQIAVMVVCAATGCSKRKLHWSGARAPQIAMEGFVIPVPTGWRDGAEADDEDLKKVLAAQPGAHGLVKEDFDGSIIVIKAAASSGAPACDELANTIAKNEGATSEKIEKLTVDGDAVCSWIYKKDDTVGHYWMRFHADKLIAVMCFPQDDKANLATCVATRDGIKLAK